MMIGALLLTSTALAKEFEIKLSDIASVKREGALVHLRYTAALSAKLRRFSPEDLAVKLTFFEMKEGRSAPVSNYSEIILKFPNAADAAAFAKSVAKPKT